jgi:hypothetical protein
MLRASSNISAFRLAAISQSTITHIAACVRLWPHGQADNRGYW